MAPDISLGGWLARRAARSPRRRALTFEDETLTYAELADCIDRVAAGLRAGGVGPGDRVGYLDFNHPFFVTTMFASARIGAVFVPINFRLAPPEVAYIVNDSGLHTLVAGPDHTALVDGLRSQLSVAEYVAAEPTDGWTSYRTLLDFEPIAPCPPAPDPDSVALVMYTSGTTGHPKGAMLTHANFWWNNVNHMHTYDVREDDVTLVFAPLFHIAGLNVTTLQTWQKGGEVVLHRHFDPATALADIARYGVTTAFGVPTMFWFMSQHPDFEAADLSSIQMLVCGGAPVPEPLMKVFAARGVPMNQGYGLTETAPGLTFLTSEFAAAKIGSAGKPLLLVDIKLIDADGKTVMEPFVKGELCARGPNIMQGYWNQPEATAAAIDEEGWFRTGDIAYFDDDGFYFIADRVKDMVISGGENVYPAEVEEVLLAHPDITGVAVIGLADPKWGEAITAVVTVRAGAGMALEDLRTFAEPRLARYKLPTRLEIVDEIPLNASGKMLKRELRERFGG